MIIVGGERAEIATFFAEVEAAAFTQCRYCMPYENNRPIFIARHPKPRPGVAAAKAFRLTECARKGWFMSLI
jgi:hypothetical protein